jgi:hypothetical protein
MTKGHPFHLRGWSITIWLAIAFCCACLIGFSAAAQTDDGLNNSAEYIAGFVRYVHWRDEKSLPAWNVCIVGDLPIEQDRVYSNRLVRGKQFTVRHIEASASLAECQILDLTAVDESTASTILMRARHLQILAVGSGPTFCSSGGQICLYLGSKRYIYLEKFEVNLSAIKEAGLNISARLITLGSPRTANRSQP